jgi:hypothetical protein
MAIRELNSGEVNAVSGALSAEAGAAITVGLIAVAPASAVVVGVGLIALAFYAGMMS